jgi:hypothetical protein
MMGTYQMLRPAVDRFYFKATADIPFADIDDQDPSSTEYHAADCEVFTLGQTEDEDVFSPVPLLNSNDEAILWKVINPSKTQTIMEGDQFWGARWSGGVYVATIWVC